MKPLLNCNHPTQVVCPPTGCIMGAYTVLTTASNNQICKFPNLEPRPERRLVGRLQHPHNFHYYCHMLHQYMQHSILPIEKLSHLLTQNCMNLGSRMLPIPKQKFIRIGTNRRRLATLPVNKLLPIFQARVSDIDQPIRLGMIDNISLKSDAIEELDVDARWYNCADIRYDVRVDE